MSRAIAPKISASTPILAKSGGRTLAGHTDDVMSSFDALFGVGDHPTPLGVAWLRFFRIDGDAAAFLRHGRTAAFCHDWGKANGGFQRMLARRGEQLLRHEQLSAMMIAHEPTWRWLSAGGLDVPLILAAVVGHHLKARDVDFGRPLAEPDQLLRLHWDDPAYRATLAEGAAAIGLSRDVPADLPPCWSFDATPGTADLDAALTGTYDRLDALDCAIRKDDARARLLWATRAALVAADSAGSGLPRTGRPTAGWIRDAFFAPRDGDSSADGTLTRDAIERRVIEPRRRVANIATLNDFQVACGESVPARALLLAPCGSGKTLAAWRWVAARCGERPVRRAIFLYPTRGTATEGFRDYLADAGPEEAALVHGTADLDLDGIASNGEPDAVDRRIAEARLFALRNWPRRLLSATVDQFLGFLQHGYGPTCHLPLLVDSVVVCDEVHSYDRGMFSALLEFLKTFDVPVLCMTATMLERRREELTTVAGLTYVPGLDAGTTESDLRLAADHPRYAVRRVDDEDAARDAVDAALRAGKRVLWVVNTVDRCQRIAKQFARDASAERLTTDAGVPVYCYHSRYRLTDRKTWHGAVVDAFRATARGGPGGPVLAVTTQVCEMSLDLDADVLVTERCPATALVQRMGRCCRDAKAHETGRVGAVIVYDPPGETTQARQLPYTTQDLNGVDDVISALVDADAASQSQLETLLLKVPSPVELPKACRFTQSGAWAAAGEEQFRDSEDLGRQAILADDVDEYRRLRDPAKRGDDAPWEADGLVMSAPKKFATQQAGDGMPRWLHLVTGGVYRPALGLCDEATGPFFG